MQFEGLVLPHAVVVLFSVPVEMYAYRKVPHPPAFSVRVRDDNH